MIFDETQAKPLDLLARYRLLCENAGASRATDVPLPRELQQQLERVEAELQTRLWMAAGSGNGDGTGRPGRRSKASTAPPDEGYIEMRPLDADIAPRPRVVAAKSASTSTSSGTATVFSDGASQGNLGPGGYGVIVKLPGQPPKELSGGKARTTNNEMEMTAALEGLKAAVAAGAKEITVVSDSEYLVKGMTGWIKGWLRNGWKTSTGAPVKNKQLWEELHRLSQGRTVTWTWTRGHAGHRENERCDELAVAAARKAAGR